MNGMTRFDPFNEITRFEPLLTRFDPIWDMSDVVNRFMARPMLRGGMEFEPQIRMDVKEADGKYLVNADIPGVKKDDIHVSIEGNRVSIRAEVRQEKEAGQGERMICCERSYGMASRSFSLADEVDQSKVQAKYADGVLELTLPKKNGVPRQEIPVL